MKARLILAVVVLLMVIGAVMAAAVLDDGEIGQYSWRCFEAEDATGEHLRCVFNPQVEAARYGIATPELYTLVEGRYVVKIRQDTARCLACPTPTP